MAHASIISSQGAHPTLFTGPPKYVGAYLKPGYIEFQEIGSPAPIDWHVGDYVVYARTGKTYRLYRTPKAVEQGTTNHYGGSFLYENVQFFDDSKQLEFCPFTDLVPGDNTVHFSTQNTVSFFGKPLNVAERLQACLEAQYGSGSWSIRIVTTTDPDLLEILNTEIEFSVNGVNCLEVLDKVYDEWGGLGWIHTIENGVNVITIGASNVRTSENTTVPFAFDNGLVRVERSVANADEIGTRLYAYGSMKNMDATYYRGLDIKDAESVDIEHLMIPISEWGVTDGKPDARKAFIENASAIVELGLIPRRAYFDGTGDLPDIHPTIERMTIGEVYDAGGAGYVPDLSKWSRSQRIDEILSASNPSDHGTASEQGQKYAETVAGTLIADTNTHYEGEAIDTYIGRAVTTKAGRLDIRFGQNDQTFVLSNITGGIVFSNLSLQIYGPGFNREIPLEDPVAGDGNTFVFKLPESVSIPGAGAGEILMYLDGVVITRENHDYTQKTFTISIDTTTHVEVKVEYEIAKTLTVRIPQIGFDIDDYAALGNGKTLSMKTGMCAGRDFEIKDAAYVASADAWDLTIYRSIDEDLNIMFPNADYEIAAGDQFVLLDIAMPEMYVAVASSRLLSAAQKLLADISLERPFFGPSIDAKVVYNEGRVLREGMWMDITQEGNREYVLIDSITIDENGSNIPTYEVALRERKGVEWTENIGKSTASRSSASVGGGGVEPSSSGVTSVGIEVPAGLSVEGSPITSKGVMRIRLANGYIIPREEDIANYFEPNPDTATLIQLKSQYQYLGPKKGLIFEGVGENESSDADLYVKELTVGNSTQRVLYSPLPLITEGDQIVGDGTPGGGGGGGVDHLYKLEDVYGNFTSGRVKTAAGADVSDGQALVWNSGLSKWVAGTVGGGGTYLAGFALRLDAGTTFGIDTGSDTGTDVDFDTDHPGITPEDTVTWGAAIGDYGINLTVDTGTAVTKGLALASALNSLRTTVSGLVTGVSSVAGKAGDVSLVIADISGLQTALDGKQPSGNYLTTAVTSLGAKTGAITLGSGLSIDNNNVLTATGTTYTPGTTSDLNTGTSTTTMVWAPSVLASWLSGKNYITNSVNNLTNYYKKSETYTQTEVNNLIGGISGFSYVIAPSTSSVTDPSSHVLYLIGPTGSGADKYEEYVYPDATTGWTKIGDTSIDLSGYVNNVVASGSGNYVSGFSKSGNTLTLTLATLPAYSAGFALKLTSGAFGINTGSDTGTDVDFDTEHPGITPEDTVTWGAEIGDYGINLTIDTGTANTKGLALASALANLRTVVDGKQPAGDYLTSVPLATSDAIGGIKIGFTESGKNYPVQLSSGKAYVNVPWENTTYGYASADTAGIIKIGTGLTIDSSGVVSVTGQTQGTVTSITVNGGSKNPDSSGVVTLDNYWKSGDSRTANYVLAAPNGSNGAATFRALVAADIPTLTKSKISDFPTNVSAFTNDAGYLTTYTDTKNTTGADNTTSKIFLVGPTAQTTSNGNARTYSNSNCYASGGYLYSGGAQVLTAHQTLYNLVINNSAGTAQITYKPGTSGTYSLTLSKAMVGLSNVENTALSTWAGTSNITTLGTITSGTWSGTTIGVTKGGTGKTSIAAFAIIYASAANTYAELAPNTTSTRKFLRMTGTGSAGAAPAWDTVTKGDVGLGNVPNFTWTYESDVTYTT